jgi:ribonuclease HII
MSLRQGELDLEAVQRSTRLLAGVDEAGRGPLAGPVVAAAVILDPAQPIDALDDSKRLTARQRQVFAEQIRRDALSWAVAWADPAEIDSRNILAATLMAMARAVAGLNRVPELVMVDGDKAPRIDIPLRTVVRGDALVPAISAASILAKTFRDRWMVELADRFPGYGLEQHKGYPTPTHLSSLRELGPCPIHRRSFAPVAAALCASKPEATG